MKREKIKILLSFVCLMKLLVILSGSFFLSPLRSEIVEAMCKENEKEKSFFCYKLQRRRKFQLDNAVDAFFWICLHGFSGLLN